MSFESLGLDPKILSTLQKLKYTVATPIQIASIPAILDGEDLLGCAQTGTGKTAAFALPIIQNLFRAKPASENIDANSRAGDSRSGDSRQPAARRRKISALVLTPTRELANQVEKSFATYGRSLGLRQAVIYGGVSQNPQVTALRAGVDIVIATPGRLLDLMEQGFVDLNHVKVLVLDEADQMLDMGFIQPMKRIVAKIPRARQTLMFSATMPPEIQRLAEQWLKNPKTVKANVVARPPEKIKQSVAFIDQSRKSDALIDFLQNTAGERQLVFCRTKHGADRLVRHLERAKIPALAIHGNKSQNARERALASFSSDSPPVLIATDVAARGLHMPGISHVINYDLPETPETYVHRIGRTARAGAEGESISFVSSDERQYLRGIERLIGRQIEVIQLAGIPVPKHSDSERAAKSGGRGHADSSSRAPRSRQANSRSERPRRERKPETKRDTEGQDNSSQPYGRVPTSGPRTVRVARRPQRSPGQRSSTQRAR
ncbi:MAG: DEAD/DEAH box helicase [Pirellulaceae bacterium]